MRLKYKLLAELLIITVIPISIIGTFLYFYMTSVITRTTIDDLNAITILQKQRIDAIINKDIHKISTLAGNEIVISKTSSILDEGNVENKIELDSFLNQTKSLEDQYYNISILDLHGKVISSTERMSINKLYYNQEVFTVGKSNKYLNIDLDKESKPVLFLTSPIMQNEVIIGTLIAEVNPNEIFDILGDYAGLGKTGEMLLAKSDSDGNAMIIAPTRFDLNSAFKKIISKSNINTPIIHAIYGQQSNFADGVDYRGHKVFAVTSYFPITQWGFVVKIDNNEAFANLENDRNAILFIIMTVISVSVTASLFLSKTISKPINDLRLACRNVTKGSHNVNVMINSPEPEYQDLTADINYMINEFKKTEKNKDEFLSMISHELKTPLVSILGYCEMLSDPNMLGNLETSQSEALYTIYNNSKKLRQLIDDLLVIQFLEHQTLKFDKKEIHVAEIMKSIINSNKILMKKKNITFVNSTSGDMIIKSDSLRLTQIFNNLIQNSADFVQQDGKIEIGASFIHDKVIFYVKDNGIGIPKEKQKDLFKKFYQVDTSLQRSHGGTGLGLAICKGLVEGLGGNIWVESEEGKGSSFYFSLPISDQ